MDKIYRIRVILEKSVPPRVHTHEEPPRRVVVRHPTLYLLVDDMHILESPLNRIALEYRGRTAQSICDVHDIGSLAVGVRARKPHVYALAHCQRLARRDRLPYRTRSLAQKRPRRMPNSLCLTHLPLRR